MSTPVSDIRPYVRSILQDDGTDGFNEFADYQIDQALKLVVAQGKVSTYTLSGGAITPELTLESDGVAFTRFAFHAARRFAAGKTDFAFNTRAYSERSGVPRELTEDIAREIFAMESNGLCSE